MAPKKATTSTKKAATSSHASYQDMIKEAIMALKERTGSSRQALKKYVQANNNLTGVTDAQFTTQFNRALQNGSEKGVFSRPKGPSGPVKLAQPGSKTAAPAAAKTTTTKTSTTKAPAKAKATTKKAPVAKTTTKKTTTTKKAPAKKTTTTTTTKSKANTSKVRKTPAAAPAVAAPKPETLGKTKSGRVVKTTATQPAKKAATTKKKAPAKKATPKKSKA